MASPVGPENPDVAALEKVREMLFREPYVFQFFQAVRLLGRMQPERAAVGRYANPSDETVRFNAHPSVNFPASQIQALRPMPDGQPAMDIDFMGLIGPLGAMPVHITELVLQRMRAKDFAMRDFFNMFNHRLTSFFYQAWEKHHFTVGYERNQNDPVTNILYSIIGFGTPGLRLRQPVRDEGFIFYSGLFGLAPKSAVALESFLMDYFDVPVEIEPFVGVWRKLDDQDQCTLGEEFADTASLGFGVVAGDEVWDQQSRARIKLGPLKAARYRDFLPNGSAWPALQAITRTFKGNDVEFEVQLILEREDVPACELGNIGDEGPQLGWYTWMKSKPEFDRNPDDTILLLLES
jgi:type VI secretion system protein ImpH